MSMLRLGTCHVPLMYVKLVRRMFTNFIKAVFSLLPNRKSCFSNVPVVAIAVVVVVAVDQAVDETEWTIFEAVVVAAAAVAVVAAVAAL